MKIVCFILTLMVVVAGAYVLLTPQVPPGEAAPTMQTYMSPAYGIVFAYPDTYALQEREVGNGERYHYTITLIDKEALANVPQNGEGPPAITIDIFQNNLDQLGIEAWVRGTSFSNFKLSPDGLISSTAVAGVPALTYAWDGLYRGESVVFAHNDNILMAGVQFLDRTDQIVTDFYSLLASLELKT